jgi:type IV pilus assembly protein PilN
MTPTPLRTVRSVHSARSIGGFNLLPWRRRVARDMRRRIALEWLAAVLVGCLCAAPFAGWRVWQRVQLDGERRALDQSLAPLRAPLAQQRELVRGAVVQRLRIATARQRAEPLARLFRLLDRLAAANVDGVSLHQVVHRAGETELQATVSGEAATAAWLARLRALPDVEAVSVREMKRSPVGAGRADERQHGPLQVTAHLVWVGAAADRQPGRSSK